MGSAIQIAGKYSLCSPTQERYNSKESVLGGHLCCATNNTAATVLGVFRTAVEQFGLSLE